MGIVMVADIGAFSRFVDDLNAGMHIRSPGSSLGRREAAADG